MLQNKCFPWGWLEGAEGGSEPNPPFLLILRGLVTPLEVRPRHMISICPEGPVGRMISIVWQQDCTYSAEEGRR